MSRDKPEPDSRCAEVKENNATREDETHRARIAALCQQHENALLRMLLPRVGSIQAARDVAHEAYVRVLALDRPGTVSFLKGFLWKTAANLATDQGRTQKYRNMRSLILASEPELSSPSPESVWVTRERLEICQRAIAELPPKCRTAFILRVFAGLKFEEVSRRMRIDISGVKRHVARATAHCRRAVDAAEQVNKEY
jgi:RNA polymerase sigma factor (sigma-70 family)